MRLRLLCGRAGDVLISLNPYSRIPELYQIASFLDKVESPRGIEASPAKLSRKSLSRKSVSAATPSKTAGADAAAAAVAKKEAAAKKEAEAPPHVYSTARRAYSQLVKAYNLCECIRTRTGVPQVGTAPNGGTAALCLALP